MFQKFFEDTLMGSFIKNLLATTPVPNMDCVTDGDIILQDNNYLYGNNLIRCTKSGYIQPKNVLTVSDGDTVTENTFYMYQTDDQSYAESNKLHRSLTSGRFFAYDLVKSFVNDTAPYTTDIEYININGTLFPTEFDTPACDLTVGKYCIIRHTNGSVFINDIVKVCKPIPADGGEITPHWTNLVDNGYVEVLGLYADTKIAELDDFHKGNFFVTKKYDENDITCTHKYHSKYNYYDSETHKFLGEYVRFMRVYQELDMTPYYNCYNAQLFEGIHLVNKDYTYETTTNKDYKVIAVPIKFNRTYTIALDCDSEVLMRGIIFGSSGLISYTDTLENTKQYYSDKEDMINSFRAVYGMTYTQPVTYRVSTADSDLYKQQRNLYLLIQVPASNTSSVVVLEGDYHTAVSGDFIWNMFIKDWKETYIDNDGNEQSKDYEIEPSFQVHRNLSLLTFNNGINYAFSSKMCEYLLSHIVYANENLTGNIKRVQIALADRYEDYANYMAGRNYGVWDDRLAITIKRFLKDVDSSYTLSDCDGNVGVDLEKIFTAEGVTY